MKNNVTLYGFTASLRSGDEGTYFCTRQAAERFSAWAWTWTAFCPQNIRLTNTGRVHPDEIYDTPDRPWATPSTPPRCRIGEVLPDDMDVAGWGTETPEEEAWEQRARLDCGNPPLPERCEEDMMLGNYSDQELGDYYND